MIRAHALQGGRVAEQPLGPQDRDLPPDCVWLDLIQPSHEEEAAAESWLDIELPSREEMQEIEASSRLYEQDGAFFLTATLVASADTAKPETSTLTFVLTERCLVTIRYTESAAFRALHQALTRQPALLASRPMAMAAIIDAAVDRLADLLERVQANLDGASRQIFDAEGTLRGRASERMLSLIGQNGDLVSKVRESLVSFARLDGFARRLEVIRHDHEAASRMKTVGEDIQSLTDHASFLNSKVDFLLNATLGKISIEQNATIKIFSVVAVIFMPPTLIASIYGMNFERMPELGWSFGYPAALLAMAVAAVLPYLLFKRRGWL